MARFVAPELHPDTGPAGPIQMVASLLRRLKVPIYIAVALLLVAVLGAYLPLATWLILCGSLAAPTLASALLVAGD